MIRPLVSVPPKKIEEPMRCPSVVLVMELMNLPEKRREDCFSPPASCSPGSPSLGLAGVLVSLPAAIITFVALVIAGVPFLQAMLITVGVQVLVIVLVVAFGYWRLSSSERARVVGAVSDRETSGHVSSEASGTWRVYSRDGDGDDVFRAGLIAPNSGQSSSIADTLAELGVEIHHSTDVEALLASVKARPEAWDLVLFDLEAAPELEMAVDDLLDFRKDVPDMPVLVMTRDVARSDFSGHRRAIADGTLRKPVFRKQLLEALDTIGVKISNPAAKAG